jgi:hypothetical protein
MESVPDDVIYAIFRQIRMPLYLMSFARTSRRHWRIWRNRVLPALYNERKLNVFNRLDFFRGTSECTAKYTFGPRHPIYTIFRERPVWDLHADGKDRPERVTVLEKRKHNKRKKEYSAYFDHSVWQRPDFFRREDVVVAIEEPPRGGADHYFSVAGRQVTVLKTQMAHFVPRR